MLSPGDVEAILTQYPPTGEIVSENCYCDCVLRDIWQADKSIEYIEDLDCPDYVDEADLNNQLVQICIDLEDELTTQYVLATCNGRSEIVQLSGCN